MTAGLTRRRILSVGALVACAAAWLQLATTASAGPSGPTRSLGSAKGLKYLRATSPNVSSQAGAPAACPEGNEATGGGGSISGSGATANLNATHPVAAGEGWQAEGTSPAGGRTVATYAICGAGQVSWLSTGNDPTSAGQSSGRGGACEGTQLLTGGGVHATGGNSRIVSARPAPPDVSSIFDWTSVVENAGAATAVGGQDWGCSDDYSLQQRSASIRVPDGEAAAVVARCERGEAVSGGGLALTRQEQPQAGAWATATRPWDSKGDNRKTPDDGWLVRARNSSGERAKLTSFAICKT